MDCRHQIVQGAGDPSARILFVGQNPGAQEDKEGKPFVGPSGKLLGHLCDAAGINRGSVWRTNAVRCASPGNRPPKRDEILNCRDYLIEEIRELNPAVIVTLGATPLTSLYAMGEDRQHVLNMAHWEDECKALEEEWADLNQETVAKGEKPLRKFKPPLKPKAPKLRAAAIKDVAGHTLIQPDTGIPMIATYHPSFLMRGNWEQSTMVIEHFKKAQRIATGRQVVGKMGEYHVVDSLDKLAALREYLLSDAVETIWFDSETTGLKWMKDELLCLSFSGGEGEGYVVPILHNPGNGQPDLHPAWENDNFIPMLKELRTIFGSNKPKGGQNVIFDLRMLERSNKKDFVEAATAFGIKVNGEIRDTELTHHSIAEQLPHNMTTTLALYTDMPFYEDEIKHLKKAMATVPNNVIWPYSAADADGLPRLWNSLRPVAEEEGTSWVTDNITAPMLRVCRDIEERGFLIDLDHFNKLCKFYDYEIAKAEELLWKLVPHRPPGWKYNYAPTLRDVLFKELKLPTSGRKTKSSKECQDCADGVCFEHDQTGKDALKDISLRIGGHSVLDAIMNLKFLTKRKSTYLDGGNGGWKKHIRPDGRIHTTMKVSRAETGRLASEEPNVQNLPNYVHIHPIGATCSDKECTAFFENTFGLNTENAFHDMIIAPPGKVIMNADWSQLEVWVLAYRLWHDTGDRTLLDVLESGTDIHLYMARKMFPDVGAELSDKDWKNTYAHLRRRAKTAVFGIGYGLTEQGFMLRERCTLEEAQEIIERYKKVVPGLTVYFRMIREQAYRMGYVENDFGRRRHATSLSLLKAMRAYGDLEGQIREMINFPIQSSGSDLHSIASYQTYASPKLKSRGCDVLISVHDSLTFESDAPDNQYVHETAWAIKDMWGDVALNTLDRNGKRLGWTVPVELEWGQRWGSPEWKLDAKGTLQELNVT